jgi:hypothetical protein
LWLPLLCSNLSLLLCFGLLCCLHLSLNAQLLSLSSRCLLLSLHLTATLCG